MYDSKIVVPIKAEKATKLDDAYSLSNISLDQLQDWKYSKYNTAYLKQGGIPFCITYTGHKGSADFLSSLKSCIQHGLDRQTAVAALTTQPAAWLKLSNEYGQLKKGYVANFFISDLDPFTDKATILQHFVRGVAYVEHNLQIPDLRGTHRIYVAKDTFKLKITGTIFKPTAKMTLPDGTKKTVKITIDENGVKWRLDDYFFYSNSSKPNLNGYFTKGREKGSWTSEFKTPHSDFPALTTKVLAKHPRKAFAYATGAKDFVIRNCTVWTCDENGIVPRLDVLVRNGKIMDIGENLQVSDVMVIDGTGMHLTPGLIDEHSHIAIKRGVNEGTQAITAEVRIQDVVNADDINIYRQVAGGTTTSHLLHGSANPIGGQTALIKLKYGLPVRDLLFDTDHRFIKFALGENVKQSNWGDKHVVRYPQTRMGVEQVFVDGFTRAKKYSALRKTDQIGIDWELEALNEIIESKRFITCHSYQQGEINMLMHVADSFGFTVNTFTHILEGYKVADKMKAHGVAASTFSDWWAYKFEVNDAIPFNAALLNEVGVLTGINSDDAEMGRRLNQEAAKAVKYGGVSEEDALKMVTINPAKMLHIDNRVGSISIGKDADLVLWTDNPLSNYSKVHSTWIEGVLYFSIETDKEEQTRVEEEKQEIINEMLNSKDDKKPFKPKTNPEYHCDSMETDL